MQRRFPIDLLQNLLIVLLSLSAAALLLLTLRHSAASEAVAAPARSVQSEASPTPLPLNIVLSTPLGRGAYSCTDDAHAEVLSLMGEALGAAEAAAPETESDFLAALSGDSILFDFLSPLPLSLLSDRLGEELDDETQVRALLLASDGSLLTLHLATAEGCLRRPTALTSAALETLLRSYSLGNVWLGIDTGRAIAPLSILPTSLSELPALSAATVLPPAESALLLLEFNSWTNARYTDERGNLTVFEEDRTLRLLADGTVQYLSLSGGYPLSDPVSVPEIGSRLSALLNRLIPESETMLSMSACSRGEDGTLTLLFDYRYGGLPIRFSDGAHAAVAQVKDGQLISLTLRCRSYHSAEEERLLPTRTAAAIAEGRERNELKLLYTDSGSERLSPLWVSEPWL